MKSILNAITRKYSVMNRDFKMITFGQNLMYKVVSQINKWFEFTTTETAFLAAAGVSNSADTIPSW